MKKNFSPDPMRQFLRDLGTNPPAPITAADLKEWYDDALANDDPMPSQQVFDDMARELNFIAERSGGAGSPLELEYARRFMGMWNAANQFRAAVLAFREFDYHKGNLEDMVHALYEVDAMLDRIQVSDIAFEPPPPDRGAPKSAIWHEFGYYVEKMIRKSMEGLEYNKGLSGKKECNITAVVGAAIICHFFNNNISAAGFAEAMKRRSRGKSKPQNTAERFPGVKPVRVIR